jgi:hypothetical protein
MENQLRVEALKPGRILVQLDRPGETHRSVRLSDLLVFLERLSGALGSVDRAVNGRQSTYFNIADLKYGSALIELEECVQDNKRAKRHTIRSVVDSFGELVNDAETITRPFWATPAVLKKVRQLADPLPHTARAVIAAGACKVPIDEAFRDRLDELLSPDSRSNGQLTGRLDAINMHGRRHAYIYPLVGHQKVVCDFSSQSDGVVVSALQQRVRIQGELRRRAGDPFPYFVEASQIEILPPDHELPSLRSLRGIYSPNFDSSTVDFQRRLRNE